MANPTDNLAYYLYDMTPHHPVAAMQTISLRLQYALAYACRHLKTSIHMSVHTYYAHNLSLYPHT